MVKRIASLEIWDNEAFAIPVLSFLDAIVNKHKNLDLRRYSQYRMVISEILRTRIKNAFPGESGHLYVDIDITDRYLEVSVRDKGQPGWQDFSYDVNRVGVSKRDFKYFLLNACADDVGMERLGKDGQRIFARLNILNPIEFVTPKPYEKEEALDTNISIKPVECEKDIVEAIRCIYSEYGYSYAYERLYYVDTFMQMIKNKDIMSYLAVNDHGQVAGHFALAFSDMYKSMPEISSVVIRQEFRGLGLFSKFMKHSIEIAKENNFRALMGQPVGFHVMSQKAFLRENFTSTSLLMSYLGSDLESEYNEEKKRLDLTVSVKIIDPDASSTIYSHKELVPFIKKMYDRLGWKYTILDGQGKESHLRISVENIDALVMKRVVLYESNEDLEATLLDTIQDAIGKKYEMIEMALLLNAPSCDYGYEISKKCGFSVSGLIPGGENGDYLILQYIVGGKPDYDGLVLTGEFEELRDDIKAINNRGVDKDEC